jgi:hypothetical protein
MAGAPLSPSQQFFNFRHFNSSLSKTREQEPRNKTSPSRPGNVMRKEEKEIGNGSKMVAEGAFGVIENAAY